MKDLTLRDLAREVEWVTMKVPHKHYVKSSMREDEIHLGCKGMKPRVDIINKVRVRIGSQVAKILGWKGGDKICAYHHPDHVFAIRLIKSTNGGGWKVRKIPNSTILEFTFPWKLVTPLRFRAVAAVDYTTPRDEYLAFIMDFPKEPKEKMLERAKEEQRASLM